MNIKTKFHIALNAFSQLYSCPIDDLPLAVLQSLRWQIHPATRAELLSSLNACDLSWADFQCNPEKRDEEFFLGIRIEASLIVPRDIIRIASIISI